MAKEKYNLIPHDDLDLFYFNRLLGPDKLGKLFLNDDGLLPRVNIQDIGKLLTSDIKQFSTTKDIETIINYHKYLGEKLTKKIKNYKHKEDGFQKAYEELIAQSISNQQRKTDTSILDDIETMIYVLLHPLDEAFDLGDVDVVQIINNPTEFSKLLQISAQDIAERLATLANELYKHQHDLSLPGTQIEFLAYIVIALLIELTQNLSEQWLSFEASNRKDRLDVTDDRFPLAATMQIAMEYGHYHVVVKTFLFAAYYILLHIEEKTAVQKRSQTLSPDRFLYQEQIKRSFDEGSKHKLDYVPTSIRNITYKIWLYYWQHTLPKFKCSTSDATDGPYVTAKEMILALAEAFPNTAIAFADTSSDGLAGRRNIISELYKYPSLVNEYFNHKACHSTRYLLVGHMGPRVAIRRRLSVSKQSPKPMRHTDKRRPWGLNKVQKRLLIRSK